MSLEKGSSIAHYEITGKLGAGGMGEVYRATDGKLRREVAIKVLPSVLADDPERLARLEREAQILASLNHPNIAGIHGLEEAPSTGSGRGDGSRCLVLELVEGKTLAELIEAGPMPPEKAVPLALQIAEALEAAHEKGVIHRDLKPANVKVTPDGTVKVLDFGLAKAFNDDAAASAPDAAHSPTLTMAATQAGIIMGTAAYMSPEQAAGQPADRRSDVWSFGVVLLEMLTGRSSFSGETVSHTLAAVLKDEPAWDHLPPDLSPRLRELLERCLNKKARHRLQAIGDARIVLEDWLADPEKDREKPQAPGEAPAPRRASRVPWIVAAALALGLVATLALLWPNPPAPRTPVQADLVLPIGQALFRGYGSSVALSPDGSKLAYSVGLENQERALFVRALDQREGIRLAADFSPYHPFFSSDGEWIGFVTRDALFKVPVRGGTPIKLTDVSLSRGASWGDDGSIVFTPNPTDALYRISASGGAAEPLTEVGDNESHRWPQVLPGSKAVLFTSKTNIGAGSFGDAQIEVLLLDSGERRVLHRGGTYARYVASGHLVFASEGALFAAPFDIESLSITGTIVPVLEGLSTSANQGGAQFDVSNDGRLVYAAGDEREVGSRIVRVERDGTVAPLSDDIRPFADPQLSPDGTRLAVDVSHEGKRDVWIYDLARRLSTRITSGIGDNWTPIWSPDGDWILYAAGSGDSYGIVRIAADGSGTPETLLEDDVLVRPLSVSPDNKRLLYFRSPSGRPDVLGLDLETGQTAPIVEGSHIDYDAQFSPDGRWIAYGSNESGTFEIYVIPSAGGRGRWQISDGGIYPRWSADGKTVFYRNDPTGDLYAVSLETGTGNLTAKRPRLVLETDPFVFETSQFNFYTVDAQGRWFVMMEDQHGDSLPHEHLSLVLDWDDALRAIAGP
jgi:serine/threonine-protein kinase